MTTLKGQLGLAAAVSVAAVLAACSDGRSPSVPAGSGFGACLGSPPAALPSAAVALLGGNEILRFNPSDAFALDYPDNEASISAVTGMGANETLVGIDYRPADGTLVGLSKSGTSGKLYTIGVDTGVAALIVGPALTLTGTSFGIDFNPTADALRIVSDGELNLRVSNIDGAPYTVTAETSLAPVGSVVGAAYTNNFKNAPITTLYGIDSSGELVMQGTADGATSPNGGAITVVGSLGTGALTGSGFDIDAVSGVALAAFSRNGTTSQLFAVNLATGSAGDCYGSFPTLGHDIVVDLALPTSPLPAVAYAISGGDLVSFEPTATGIQTVATVATITGLQGGESIAGLDFRPATGLLYGLGDTDRIYKIDRTTGVATVVAAAAFTPASTGSNFGFTFNPVTGLIRVVSDAGENFRVSSTTGKVSDGNSILVGTQYDPSLASSGITAAAHTNNVVGGGSTTLFVLDTATGDLVLQGGVGGGATACPDPDGLNPNCGVLTNIGSLGLTIDSGNSGFDIVGGRGVFEDGGGNLQSIGDTVSYAALETGGAGVSYLYRVNLVTGVATQIGSVPIGGASPILVSAMTVRVARP